MIRLILMKMCKEIMEYYMKRKHRYYFRNKNEKLIISGDDIILRSLGSVDKTGLYKQPKKGDKFIVEVGFNI